MKSSQKPQSRDLLRSEGVKVHFPVLQGTLWQKQVGIIRAVDGVSLTIQKGETVGLVGESGCGKSTLGRALIQLIKPTAGAVYFDGQNITKLWKKGVGAPRWQPELRQLRRRMQIIFQDPYASLNPRMTVEDIVGEPLRTFKVAQGLALRQRVQDTLQQVGMDPRYVRRYPHEFSGGQRQRIGIARALALSPDFIVADEPTSALDVSIKGQILNLLHDLKTQLNLTLLFIAHDLAAVRHLCDRVAVMYLGRVVEEATADALFARPTHPYTKALLAAIPVPDPRIERAKKRLVLVGDVPSPMNPPSGCPFHPRCPERMPMCSQEVPAPRQVAPGHTVACHLVTTSQRPNLH
jgi:oligopeptide transport system ATP-binding protein